MSFYSDASLAMIPSGYKDQKVYSAVPTDGSGDLVFSRASSATRVASNGLIEKVRTNLQTYSQNFTAAGGWGGDTITATANYGTAPDGTQTSTRLQFSSANHVWQQSVTGINGNLGVFSLYIKGTAGETIQIAYGGTDKLVTIGTGWTRVNTNGTVASTGTININTYGGNARDFEVWGGQTELGDIATDYIATTSAAVSVGPVSGLPRLDYLDSSAPRLLLEPQRTNVALNSESVASDTNVGYTVTANNTASPDGYVNADRILEDTGTLHLIQKEFTVGSTTDSYAVSFFVKANGRTSGQIIYGLNAVPYASITSIFDLTAGTITAPNAANGATAGSSKIENYGNGWYRVSVSGVVGFTGTHYVRIQDTNGGAAGDPTKGFYVYGFQAELGAYATSYIPTLGTSVTRVADAASKTGIGSLLSASEYTLYWEGTHIPTGQYNSFMTIYKASDLNSSARFYRNNTNNEIRAAIYNSVSGLSLDLSSGVTTQTAKCALRVKAGSYAFYINGSLVNSSTSALTPNATLDVLNLQYLDSSQSYDSKTAQALFFKTGLTNDQLASLTTL